MARYMERERERRAAEGLSEGEMGSNSTTNEICSNTAIIAERNETTGEMEDVCALLCIKHSKYSESGAGKAGEGEPDYDLKGVFWDSWRSMSNKSLNGSDQRCYLTGFEFQSVVQSVFFIILLSLPLPLSLPLSLSLSLSPSLFISLCI